MVVVAQVLVLRKAPGVAVMDFGQTFSFRAAPAGVDGADGWITAAADPLGNMLHRLCFGCLV